MCVKTSVNVTERVPFKEIVSLSVDAEERDTL